MEFRETEQYILNNIFPSRHFIALPNWNISGHAKRCLRVFPHHVDETLLTMINSMHSWLPAIFCSISHACSQPMCSKKGAEMKRLHTIRYQSASFRKPKRIQVSLIRVNSLSATPFWLDQDRWPRLLLKLKIQPLVNQLCIRSDQEANDNQFKFALAIKLFKFLTFFNFSI